jgi:hypothetical protein
MTWSDGNHLFSIYDALYRSLGESAPTLSNDALVVRTHELSRLFGAQALRLRDTGCVEEPSSAILAMLEHAHLEDPTGALSLFVVTMLLSPRLLVWLRDLNSLALDASQREIVVAGQDLLVTSMHETGAILATQPALTSENLELVVQTLLEMLRTLGWDEHLGPRY